MDTKKVLSIISKGTLSIDPIKSLSGAIEDHMFTHNDILEIIEDYQEDVIFIKFKDINGSIPFRFLDTSAQKKVLKWKKIRSTRLWKIMK
jgi:hypothetical protein